MGDSAGDGDRIDMIYDFDFMTGDGGWHGAINEYSSEARKTGNFPKFMYEAKKAAMDLPRLVELFKQERLGQLPEIHQQHSRSQPEAIVFNRLSCCLGEVCRECPILKSLDGIDESVVDFAKAWTCISHIISSGGDFANEGYILTKSDTMFWHRVYENLSHGMSGEGE